MSAIIIRRTTINDRDEFVALRLKLFRESGYLRIDEPLPERFLAWVALAENRLIGISCLLFFQESPTEENLTGLEAYVMNMYTLPEWRGQSIAKALLA